MARPTVPLLAAPLRPRAAEQAWRSAATPDLAYSAVITSPGCPNPAGLLVHTPSGSPILCLAARAHAFLVGRAYVTPQDVKDVALDVLRHRVLLTYEAEAEETTSDDVVQKVLESVPVP